MARPTVRKASQTPTYTSDTKKFETTILPKITPKTDPIKIIPKTPTCKFGCGRDVYQAGVCKGYFTRSTCGDS